MRKATLVFLVIGLLASPFYGHDLFLKLDSYLLKPSSPAAISLFNGTFEESENVITRDRLRDVSIVGPERERTHPDTAQWRDVGSVTVLDFETGPEGTYVVGVSTHPRMIALSARDFNRYLQHDGLLDVLDARKQAGELDRPARERYAKHVKAIIQVGERRTGAFAQPLGYPVEVVPLTNPYELKVGDRLRVRCLRQGEPLANQLVYAGYAPRGSNGDEGDPAPMQVRTDHQGMAGIKLERPGHWYIRFIHMRKVAEEGVDYESNWATLTFEVR